MPHLDSYEPVLADLPPTQPRPDPGTSAAQRHAEASNPAALNLDEINRALRVNNPPPPQVGVRKTEFK